MRVSQVVTAQVREGQLEAAVASGIEAAALIRPHGGDVHYYMTSVAGEQVNTTVFTMEYESPEALGAAFDSMAGDAGCS
jgi:hypothetical protein